MINEIAIADAVAEPWMVHIGWPEGIWLALLLFRFYIHAARHGEQQDIKYNFYTCFVGSLIAALLLLWGGFFD